MIPDAFYTVQYKYDRNAKRWAALFTSNEIDDLVVLYPVLDGRMTILGKSVECSVEEDLALAFMQQVDVIRLHQNKEAREKEAGPGLDVPVQE